MGSEKGRLIQYNAPMHFVTETLLVGNVDDAQKPPPYVNGVLFLAQEFTIKPPKGVAYEFVPLQEFGEASPGDVKKAVDWLEQHAPSKRLMVCCRAGMGRSVSMVIAYLVCVKGMTYADAVQLLKARRPGATPLPNLERTIATVQRMRQGHGTTQDRTPDHDAGQNPIRSPGLL